MKPFPRRIRLLIIDKQDYWRELSASALRSVDYDVNTQPNYTFPPPGGEWVEGYPDLVILGCARVGPAEMDLIKTILEREAHLLVLSTSLSWQMMRTIFLAGADDVEGKSYDPTRLIHVVKEALETTQSHGPDVKASAS
jgi:DNA-binding response OmpR family regulator